MDQKPGCVFCNIVSRESPATIRYEDGEVIVIDNLLRWVPVMLLVLPKRHVGQQELWTDGLLAKVGRVAVEVGDRFCPGGYRILSNFGRDGLQSQEHGHVHVLGGTHLGHYA
jgi:histidine triad (HIT) family protein